jgi:transcriptional repressor NrdR
MLCPFCTHLESKVVNSRQSGKGDAIRRRRECLKCGHRFTTFEVIEKVPIIVVKRDGKRELFDRQKVTAGILRACEKRPVTLEEVERIVQFVEKTLYNNMEKEVSSLKIGEMVLKKLRDVDEVAYVRFASVYRQFRDVSEFNHEVKVLRQAEPS